MPKIAYKSDNFQIQSGRQTSSSKENKNNSMLWFLAIKNNIFINLIKLKLQIMPKIVKISM